MTLALENVRVLVVEDDPIIGMDLSETIAAAGAVVVGPAHDVRSAMALLEAAPVHLAVLDHLIIGSDSRPIADFLVQRAIAILLHTSHRGDLPRRYPFCYNRPQTLTSRRTRSSFEGSGRETSLDFRGGRGLSAARRVNVVD